MNAPLRQGRADAPLLQVADRIGALATRALQLELDTWPKPGLVSPRDPGSHQDMDAATLRRSIEALAPFFAELGWAGRQAAPMAELRRIGLAAEAAMMGATGGINTHRGAIFGLGLLCAAAGAHAAGLERQSSSLGAIVRKRWGAAILESAVEPTSHGAVVGRRHGAGGARREAAAGFPTLYGVGHPALVAGFAMTHDPEAARIQACFALIATLDDTNLLHRGGPEGLAFARRQAQAFLVAGGVGGTGWRDRAAAVHRAFVARRLSPGGSADLLAMALFVDALEDRGGAAA